jgi:hypothetical protein
MLLTFVVLKKSNFPRETFVEVSGADCLLLNRLTLFDCNSVIIRKIAVLAGKLRDGVFQDKGYVGDGILEKLCYGVKSSPVVENDIKEKI